MIAALAMRPSLRNAPLDSDQRSVRYRTDSAGSSRSLGDIGHAGSFREFAA
jgi:hypothetical protein